MESLRIVGILLQPYMPTKMSQLLDILGVEETRRTFEFAVIGADDSYGVTQSSPKTEFSDTLFPPLPQED